MQYQLTSKFISYDIYNLTFHALSHFTFCPFLDFPLLVLLDGAFVSV